MPSTYILYSKSSDSYYIGATNANAVNRLQWHIEKHFENSYSAKAGDWELFLEILCDTYTQALKIEKHIKRMKSKSYIQNLNAFPDITTKLKEMYK